MSKDTRAGAAHRQRIVEDILTRTGIDDAMIENLVRTFYGRVRRDPLIGPVFESRVEDWEAHFQRLIAFWSSVALMSGRYHGQPMAVHVSLPIDTAHFDRWLEIFAATAREVCPPAAAEHFLERAFRIADSLELGIAAQKGEIRSRRPRSAGLSKPVEVSKGVAAAEQDPAPTGCTSQLSSPASSIGGARDGNQGCAGQEELIACLNELLESERAGAHVTLESAREAGSGPLAELMRGVQKDEARWCAMLFRRIQALGGEPSPKTGAFYGKAMAIANLGERVAFINRGQGWVARRLREVLPRIRDDDLRADLAEMLRSHKANIDLVNGQSSSV
jgi:hemoglobin